MYIPCTSKYNYWAIICKESTLIGKKVCFVNKITWVHLANWTSWIRPINQWTCRVYWRKNPHQTWQNWNFHNIKPYRDFYLDTKVVKIHPIHLRNPQGTRGCQQLIVFKLFSCNNTWHVTEPEYVNVIIVVRCWAECEDWPWFNKRFISWEGWKSTAHDLYTPNF